MRILWRARSESAVRPIGKERCGTGRPLGKSCRIDLIVLRIPERLLPSRPSYYKPLSRSVWHRLLRLFTSIQIKIERSVFVDRSKLKTEPMHFRTLWVRSDQTPPTFRTIIERAFFCGLTDRIEPIVVSEHTLQCETVVCTKRLNNVKQVCSMTRAENGSTFSARTVYHLGPSL